MDKNLDVDKFNGKKILVIGDIMLDQYLYGEVTRLSQEAPMILADIFSKQFTLGGAGNVASNLAALGAQVTLIAACGKDGYYDTLKSQVSASNIYNLKLTFFDERKTTVKTRVIASNQQIFRYDWEDLTPIESQIIDDDISTYVPIADAVLISDYAKGMLTNKRIKQILKLCKQYKKPVVVDSKVSNLKKYIGCTVITPNLIELAGAFGIEKLRREQDILKYGWKLSKLLKANVLITRGKDGMTLFRKDNHLLHTQAIKQKIIDPCGAGDSV